MFFGSRAILPSKEAIYTKARFPHSISLSRLSLDRSYGIRIGNLWSRENDPGSHDESVILFSQGLWRFLISEVSIFFFGLCQDRYGCFVVKVRVFVDFVFFVLLDWLLLVGHLGLRSSCSCLLLFIKIESLWDVLLV